MRYLSQFFVGLVVIASFVAGLFSGIEFFFEDIFFSPKPVSEEIVIVAIDNESIEKIGQWPWPRAVFAQAFDRLAVHPPRAVGFDVILAEPSRLGATDDNKLASSLEALSFPVVMPFEAKGLSLSGDAQAVAQGALRPLPLFSETKAVSEGHVNLILSSDGVARRIPFEIVYDTASIQSLAVETVGGDARGRPALERIVFAGPPGTFRRIPFWRLLEGDLPDLSGKYVFIGSTASDLHDEKPTPFARGTQMSGVEIQANIANMVLKEYRLAPLAPMVMYAWLLFAALLPGFVFEWMRRPIVALAVNIIVGVIYTVAVIVLFGAGYIGNFVHIQLAWILGTAAAFLYRYLSVDKERRQMRHAFSKYVSADVLSEIMRDPSKVKLGGDEKEVTVFFSDVRGFTSFSEKLTPSELTAFLNRYLTIMTDIALERRGVLDKYIGDAIMAFWGAPLSNPNHAKDAIETSLVMVDALAVFNKESAEKGELSIDIGIGLNSGHVVAGNMGSHQRFDYTVMGDTVNLASRLEGQTKTYGVHIIASEHTVESFKKSVVQHDVLIREIDRIKVKGKAKPVVIFEIVERAKEEFVRSIVDHFTKAREAYYAGKWAECLEICNEIFAFGDDGPTKVFAERCAYFAEHPPERWEGVYEFKTK